MYTKVTTILLCLTMALLVASCREKTGAGADDDSSVKAIMMSDSVPESVKKFVTAVADNDRDSFSEMVNYPLQRPYPLHDIPDAEAMREHYNDIIDDSIRNLVIHAGPERWKEYGWRGWSLDDGKYIWVSDNVYDLQYVSTKEQQLIDSLTNEEIRSIEPTIRDGWRPVMCLLNTDNGRIYRVDIRTLPSETDTDHYRLLVYDSESDLHGLPRLLLNGTREDEGSMGNVLYKFSTDEGKEVVIEPDAPDTGYPVLLEPNDSTITLRKAYWHELVGKTETKMHPKANKDNPERKAK